MNTSMVDKGNKLDVYDNVQFQRSKSLLLMRQDSKILTRAFVTLKSHKRPLSLPGIPRSSRHISFYDYLPHRKVWSEKDQRKRDRSRKVFREEVQKELIRQKVNEEARDREMFPPKDELVTNGDVAEACLEQYFPNMKDRRLTTQGNVGTGDRRLSIQSLHTFFPDIENYDFAPRRQTVGSVSNKFELNSEQGTSAASQADSLSGCESSDRSDRKVSFNLNANKRNSTINQQRNPENVGKAGSLMQRMPFGSGLTEISETGITKYKNVSNFSKLNTRMSMLHESIEDNMEASRNLNENRIIQRKIKLNSATGTISDKREPYQTLNRSHSASDQVTTFTNITPIGFARQLRHPVAQRENVVITEPILW